MSCNVCFITLHARARAHARTHTHTHTHPYLFLEVADGEFVSKSEEMTDVVLNVVVLQMVHHVSAIALKMVKWQVFISGHKEQNCCIFMCMHFILLCWLKLLRQKTNSNNNENEVKKE